MKVSPATRPPVSQAIRYSRNISGWRALNRGAMPAPMTPVALTPWPMPAGVDENRSPVLRMSLVMTRSCAAQAEAHRQPSQHLVSALVDREGLEPCAGQCGGDGRDSCGICRSAAEELLQI